MIACGLAALLPFLVTRADAAETTAPNRETLLMDFGWRFHKGDLPVNHWGKLTKTGNYEKVPGIGLGYDDSSWRPLDLPHDYAVEGVFNRKNNSGHGYLPMEIGWYRRRFDLPKADEGRRIFVEFEGAFRDMTLYVNQFIVGGHASGYGTVRLDITDYVSFGGSNVLAVRVDGTQPEGWWYEGGGIYRHVWLIKTHEVHIPFGGVQVLSWFKSDPEKTKPFLCDAPEGAAKVRVKTTVFNAMPEGADIEVAVRLIAPDGREVGRGVASGPVASRKESVLPVQLEVKTPALWSLETPQLYRALVEVRSGGRAIDSMEQPFGIRTIRFDANQGFFLNGKPLKIKGAACHHDHAGVGAAVPDQVNEYRIRRLKEFGFNAFRSAHHPHSPALLDICDRLGMLVMDEARNCRGNEESLGDIRRQVLRGRNHPSVILWNFANEEVAMYELPQGARLARTTALEYRSLDPTRPTTMSRNHDYDSANAAAIDVLGFNYYWDNWDKNHAAFPDKPVIETELASTYNCRGVYDDQFALGRLTEYDGGNSWVSATFTRQEVKRQMARPWMCGGFMWTGFDYRGEANPFLEDSWKSARKGTPCPLVISCFFGTLDTCGYPKDEAYYYKAWYGEKPSLHLFPHWNFAGKEGQEIEVVAYANTEEVELLLNGKSAGRKPMPKYDLVSWKVPYAPGAIEAVGYNGGREVLRQKRETTGPAAALKLEGLNGVNFRANREDAAMVKVSALDAEGREVPTAGNLIHFRVQGPIRLLGTGNGDPADLQSDKLPQRKLWAGLAQVIVGMMETPGKARVVAEAEGLKPAVLELELADAPRRPFVPTSIKAEEAVMLCYDGNAPKSVQAAKTTSVGFHQDDYGFYDQNAVSNPEKAKKEAQK